MTPGGAEVGVRFADAIRGVAPGQAAAFYVAALAHGISSRSRRA